MTKRELEEQSANHLLRFLKDAYGERWNIIDREVEVDPATQENFDFELACGERRIALEIFCLVGSEPELEQRLAWSQFAKLLGREMERRRLNDFSVEIPLVTRASPQAQEKRAEVILDKLEKWTKADAGSVEAPIDGIIFRREPGLGAPTFWSVGGFGMYDGVDTAKRVLERMLPKKNRQVCLPEREGVLLVVHRLGLVNSEDFTEACKGLDFGRFPNIACVYFEDVSGAIALAYNRPSS